MPLSTFKPGRLTPLTIAALYLVFGAIALFVSDVVFRLVLGDPLLGLAQGIKGALEVAVTAVFIYLLVRWSFRDIRLRDRARNAAPIGVTISDPTQPDTPIVYANDQFLEMTGYDEGEVLGRSFLFLQGEETDPEAVAELRDAIEDERPASVDVINYRKNGAKFWNKVDIAPVRDDDGTVTNYVGFQADITERKVREERLRVLNRVLRHNFRNKLTVVAGQVELLRDELEDGESLETIDRAVTDLETLTDTVRMNEAILEAAIETDARLSLNEHLVVMVDAFRDRYPEATISADLPEESPVVESAGVVKAVEEAVENAIKHNDGDDPTVEIRVSVDADDWVTIGVADDGPGVPAAELEVLREGEQPLKHGERLGLWSIHWITNLAGGSMNVEPADLGGTYLQIRIPGGE